MKKSVLLEVFGDNPINRVLDFLVVHEDFYYSMTDIAKHSGVGYATLKLFWHKLEENKIVIQTRVVGKAKMYELNLASPVVKKFRDFFWETAHQKIKEELKKEMLTA